VNALDVQMTVSAMGLEKTTRMTSLGEKEDWLVTEGRMAGNFLSMIKNARWLAYLYHRGLGLPGAYVPHDAMQAIKDRFTLLFYQHGEYVDPQWLDSLDPNRPFDWDESPPILEQWS